MALDPQEYANVERIVKDMTVAVISRFRTRKSDCTFFFEWAKETNVLFKDSSPDFHDLFGLLQLGVQERAYQFAGKEG